MIEILMCTYNAGAYLSEQINSLLNQSNTNWRLLVADDGSTDNTVLLLENYHQAYPDKISYMVNDKGTGSSKDNFLKLTKYYAEQLREDNEIYDKVCYVMYCDQDDIWEENKIDITVKRMEKLEGKYGKDIPLLVHTDLKVVDADNKELAVSFLDYMHLKRHKDIRDVVIQNSVTGCSMMINISLLYMLGDMDEKAPILMHDHAAAIIAAIYGRISLVDEATIRYRQHGDNQVGAESYSSISYKLSRYKRGREDFRENMNKSYKQVEYIIEHYGVEDAICGDEAIEMLREYSSLYDKPSKDKRKFYNKYKVYKNGCTKRLMQMLWA